MTTKTLEGTLEDIRIIDTHHTLQITELTIKEGRSVHTIPYFGRITVEEVEKAKGNPIIFIEETKTEYAIDMYSSSQSIVQRLKIKDIEMITDEMSQDAVSRATSRYKHKTKIIPFIYGIGKGR